MLNNLKQRKSDGFTIIEVMIVLAIAGLIMLIIFLAVPALQRNSRNTAIKNDVAGLLGAVNEYTNNNNGRPPAAHTINIDANTGEAQVGVNNCASPNANCAEANVSPNTEGARVVTTVPGAASVTLGNVVIIVGAACDGNTPTTAGTTDRSIAAYFRLEGNAIQCQES